MFWNMFKYKIKSMLNERMGTFWLIFWPLILSTLFNLCFSNMLSDEKFEKIDISIVASQDNKNFVDIMESTDMFNIIQTDLSEAKEKLSDQEITGYVTIGDEISATVNGSGINESILKTALDKYSQITNSYKNLISSNPSILQSEFLKSFDFSKQHMVNKDEGNSRTNLVVVYFYTVIAMSSLCAGVRGMSDISKVQANQSDVGARFSVSPAKKMQVFFASITGSVFFQTLANLLVIAYMTFILKVDFGNQIGYIILLCFVSSITGVFMGALIGAVFKKKENFKMTLIIAFTMICCFFSGMMSTSIKYLVQKNAPIFSYLNPANLITDGFYSLYYYGVGERYCTNIIILCAMSVIFAVATVLIVRRQKYASL